MMTALIVTIAIALNIAVVIAVVMGTEPKVKHWWDDAEINEIKGAALRKMLAK